jgi:LPS sulfotransferase NodH
MHARGFVTHFTARSGSTYLIYRLRQHPDLVARAEVFGNKLLPGDKEQTADNQIAFLRKYWRPYRLDDPRPDGKARGFKLQISKEHQQLIAFARYVKLLGEHDICRIFLYRRNLVKQVVSALRAHQVKELTMTETGQERAHLFDSDLQHKARALPALEVDCAAFKRQLRTLEGSYKQLRDLEQKVGSSLTIEYEDMIANPQATFDRIFECIGVKPIDVTSDEPVKKITDDNLRNVIANFDELSSYLGESYAAQLQEA